MAIIFCMHLFDPKWSAVKWLNLRSYLRKIACLLVWLNAIFLGTADGGHYYAFIRDRYGPNKDKWYSFNDAEVKPFDPNQIAAECFGGEMNSRTYDQVTDKFMDLSIEKTNSAYMLFYERIEAPDKNEGQDQAEAGPSEAAPIAKTPVKLTVCVALFF